MINGSIAPYFQRESVTEIKTNPYSLLTDGSNDVSLDKMNPQTVRIFDVNSSKVGSCPLHTCAIRGTDLVTTAAIFNKVNQVVSSHEIPWSNYIGFIVDNTSVSVGVRNSILIRVVSNNPACYFMGCPCHLVHNVVWKASSSLGAISRFDIEDTCIDMFYYLDKSMKQNSALVEFPEFCDVKYHQAIKHANR